MSNHLKNEMSPYLLQHAENPVNWYPWNEHAFEKAKNEDKPIFLSIGYSTCHWCHVMAHESFEDIKTAEILNKYFVSIKVDREERPDIDSVYMSVCRAFTGSGGWPMSIFMTPDKKPFFAGTYFPVKSQYGMIGFADLLGLIAKRWKSARSEFLQFADRMVTQLRMSEISSKNKSAENLTENAVKIFESSFDSVNGGFGEAPKFPAPHNLLFLLLYAKCNNYSKASEMAEKTLVQMRMGGIFDHIGYGFSRYSTDIRFLVPHFEKMLYDNALLIMAYSAAYCMTGNGLYLDTAEKTAEYILREMTSVNGGFYSAQDADSEGVEGKYYTFSLGEIIDILGAERGKEFAEAFDISEGGNFEGVNIPNLLKTNALKPDFYNEIVKLYDYRKKRARLHLDDKILISWNSMMIAALCMLFRATHNEEYLKRAQSAKEFIGKNLCKDFQLYTSFRSGKRSDNSFLGDYAYYIAALTEMYNSTLDSVYLKEAESFCSAAVNRFADCENGGFYLCPKDSAELFVNPKETYDGAIPSANSVMAYNFVRLYQLTGKAEYSELADKQFDFMSSHAADHPAGYSMFLIAKLMRENPPENIVAAIKEKSASDEIKCNLPFLANISLVPESEEYPLLNDSATFYVCRDHMCLPPSNTLNG